MDFKSAVSYLDGLKAHEKMRSFVYDKENFDLDKLRKFLVNYCVDYSDIKFVHVAGSKGKGTVCNLVANYLVNSGKRVGMFTSPYIIDVRECFWFNGELISEMVFAEMVAELKGFVEGDCEIELTFFEALVVLMLKYFVALGVEYAVVEVGVGGDLDATNVISAVVSVVTLLESEHLELLGGTKESLVRAKLGIVKGGEEVVIGKQNRDFEEIVRVQLEGISDVDYVKADEVEEFGQNGAIVFNVIKRLFGEVEEGLLKRVLAETKISGRFDVRIVKDKTVVFDIAHTRSSIENLIRRLKEAFSEHEFVFLLSVMADKDVRAIVSQLEEAAVRLAFTLANRERGVDPYVLAEMAKGSSCEVEADCMEAFWKALGQVNKKEILVVTGSHFLVSKILRSI